MDFTHTEGQQDLAALTREILADQVTPTRLRTVEAGPDRFDSVLWNTLAAADVLGAALPAEVGGSGFGLLEQCSILTELGRTVAPVPYLSSITMSASAIARFGTAKQRHTWAKPAALGQLVLSTALAEEHSHEAATPTTRAERVDGGWRLTGAKTTVPAAGIADLFLVPAMISDELAVFLVTSKDSGVTIERQTIVDGDAEGWLDLDGVWLDDDRMLGETGQGHDIVQWLANHGTVGLCAHQLGVAERALELTADYARNRVQFDKPIGSFQAVTQRLADAYVDVEAIRLTLWQAAWRLQEGLSCQNDVATAKFWAADGGHRVAHTAVHIHGGVGIDMDNELHRYFVAAKRGEFSLGSATTQLLRLGAELAAVPAGTSSSLD